MAPIQDPLPASGHAGEQSNSPQQVTQQQEDIMISTSEQSHLHQIELVNRDRRRAFDRVADRYATWRMYHDYLPSVLVTEHEYYQSVSRMQAAARDYYSARRAQQSRSERPYKDSLRTYRAWQNDQPPQVDSAAESSQRIPRSGSRRCHSKTKAAPLVVTTPAVTSQNQPEETPPEAVQARALLPDVVSRLAVTVGPLDSEEPGDARACHWQSPGPSSRSALEENLQRDKGSQNEQQSRYQDGAPPALRDMFNDRMTSAPGEFFSSGSQQSPDVDLNGLSTIDNGETDNQTQSPPTSVVPVEVDSTFGDPQPQAPVLVSSTVEALVSGSQQCPGLQLDDPATADRGRTDTQHEEPPGIVVDEVGSDSSDSEPQTPIEERADEILGSDKLKSENLSTLEERQQQDLL